MPPADRVPAGGAGAAAGLDAAQVARAFPFHLRLDGQLALLDAGASLRKACPAVQRGAALGALFEVQRPRAHATLEHWLAHAGQLCTLRSRGSPPLVLRGSAELLGDGSLVLLVSPVLGSMDEIAALGLGLNDFAKHDAAADLLLLTRTVQMSAQDTERLAARLRERTSQLDTMLGLSDSAVAYFDAGGRLLQCNAVLAALLGLEPDQLTGASLAALGGWLDERLVAGEPAREALRALLACEGPAGNDEAGQSATLRVHLAVPRPVVLDVRSRRSPDGGHVVFLRDVTHESEVDRMKSEFLSAAAHELRTPMSSIFGFTELLLHRQMPPARQTDVLQTIHRQTAQLIRIVDELLDLTRIEARRGEVLQREPCALVPLVQQSVSALHMQQGQRVRVVEPEFEVPVLTLDDGKFAQALGNVLGNACKFSPPGAEIVVDLLAVPPGAPAAVGVRVSDPGIGMTAEECRRVFERFYRADGSRTVPGSGLGMSLVKEIVELHGGRVEIASAPGQGTQVTLWWPVEGPGEANPAAPLDSPQGGPDGRP